MTHDEDERGREASREKHEGLWRRPQREGMGGPDWEKEGDSEAPRDRDQDPRRGGEATELSS